MVAIGIDLGTTKSAVGFKDGTAPVRIVQNAENLDLTPSVVSWRKAPRSGGEGKLLVGNDALDYAARAPADTIFAVKRLMGRCVSEEKVQLVRDRFAYTIQPAVEGSDDSVSVLLGGKPYRPEEISAEILRKLKEDAQVSLGVAEVRDAVITVPAYFEERQREATRMAGVRAGLTVKKVIDEPTAAAIAFGVAAADKQFRRVLVYDLGGGTFDISILETKGGQFEGMQIEGDTWLGGDDFDRELVNMLIDHLKSAYDLPPEATKDRRFLVLAKQAAERVKRELGKQTRTELIIEGALKDATGELIDVSMEVSREAFEQRIQPYIDRTMQLVQKALTEQNLKPDDIHQVLMVGGSTLVPAVSKAVAGMFGEAKLRRDLNPRHVVALGAQCGEGCRARSFRGDHPQGHRVPVARPDGEDVLPRRGQSAVHRRARVRGRIEDRRQERLSGRDRVRAADGGRAQGHHARGGGVQLRSRSGPDRDHQGQRDSSRQDHHAQARRGRPAPGRRGHGRVRGGLARRAGNGRRRRRAVPGTLRELPGTACLQEVRGGDSEGPVRFDVAERVRRQAQRPGAPQHDPGQRAGKRDVHGGSRRRGRPGPDRGPDHRGGEPPSKGPP
ncbi:MAG: Hsp70 family protein [Candidatus Riflebacteria bacterium]|nr:Hsp70 family protein [Candidatus Riflebacteria bacterium]